MKRVLSIAVFVALLVILISTAALSAFPHSHGYCDADCPVCALIDSFKGVGALFSSASVLPFIFLSLGVLFAPLFVLLEKKTPVNLKVKLSD